MNAKNEKAKMIQSIYSLTPLQEGMLYHYMEKKSTDYVIQTVFSLEEDVIADKLNEALALLYEKYEILRTFFIYENMKEPKQVVMKTRKAEFHNILADGTSEIEIQQKIEAVKRHDLLRGFDLQKDPLLRITYINSRAGHQKMIWSHHHIIMDGWCTSLIYGDFIRYYNLLADGRTSAEISKIITAEKGGISEYSDYVKWLDSQDQQAAMNYYQNLIDGYVEESGILSADNLVKSEIQMEKNSLLLDRAKAMKINELAKTLGITLSTVLEAAWGILLQNYNKSDDVVFGKVVSGRSADIRGIEKMVGLFINTVPVRIKITPEMTVEKLLKDTLKQSIETSSYEYCSLAAVQSQSAKGAELIKTLFAFGNFYIDEENLKSAEEKFKISLEAMREETNYDLTMSAVGNEDNIRLDLLFDPNRFSKAESELLLGRMDQILSAFSEDTDRKVMEIQILPEYEWDILRQFNQTELRYDQTKTLVDLFAQMVLEHADQTAVKYGSTEITYQALDRLSNVVAGRLKRAGIENHDFIPIIAERGIEMIAAIIGILKSGAAYVPILPDYPINRINYIVLDCAAKLVLTYKTAVDTEVAQINLDDLLESAENDLPPQIMIDPQDIAYCIYTSGTTGKPKGVLIAHQSVSAMRSFFLQEYQVNKMDNVLQFANFVFDASVWELTMSLFTGARLTLIDKSVIADVHLFNQYVKEQGITITLLPPQYYLETDIKGLRVLTTGGSAANHAVIEKAKDCEIYVNAYGPTESTVMATSWTPENGSSRIIPIGKPIANSRIYILNQEKLCGIGMIGELCIAGDGLAKGYLNNEALTAEKFPNHPYEPGKIYRTGDLARWRADGNIEYLGRVDEQVKIRGFRIELQEIEQVIRDQEMISDAVVLAREDHNKEKVLCAYIVASREIDPDHLKLKLSEELPEYMIPARIVVIDHIPLNRSGKTDISALPPLDYQLAKEYQAPETELEVLVCTIFKDVLGNGQIGADDKFYELGGDSIKAIRVVTKIREAGYDLSVKDIMKKQTVKLIALSLQQLQNESSVKQQEISGPISPTPIIKDFFNWNLPKPQHFNQSFMIDVTEFQAVDMETLFRELAIHHDILRGVVADSTIRIRPVHEGQLFELFKYDFSREPEAAEQITAQCNGIQQSMDLSHGPLFKGALFKTVHGEVLAVFIHHLLVDGVSWRILLEDTVTILKQLKNNSPIILPAKTTSFQEWSAVLAEYRTDQIPRYEKQYWEKALASMRQVKLNCFKAGSKKESRIKAVDMELGQKMTKQLLSDASSAFGTTINDLLLTALSMACYRLTGQQKVVVGMEGHGREDISRNVNIYRTVGWFTTIYPVLLCCGEDLKSSIINNKEILHGIPNNGFSYGVLNDQIGAAEIDIYFNYLGAMDHQQEQDFKVYATGSNSAIENGILGSLSINGRISDNNLSFSFAYDENTIDSENVGKLVKFYQESLAEIISYCVDQDEIIFTPSDFSTRDLNLSDFNEIIGSCQEHGEVVEDIYSLTPLQQGMLFHYMINKKTSEYIIQNKFTLASDIDSSIVLQVLELLSMKHAALRTAVHYDKIEKARQVIIKNRKIPFLSSFSVDEDIEALAAKRANLVLAKGFDLQTKPLFQVELIKGKKQAIMIWTYHHIIVDGWCLQLLFTDFIDYYEKLSSGYSGEQLKAEIIAEKAQTAPYSEYVQWLERRDEDSAIRYYEQMLDGYDHVAEFTPSGESPAKIKKSYSRSLMIDQKWTQMIKDFTKEQQVTINTVLETAYGIVLQNYSNSDDVVFGKVVSGRNVDLKGIEKTLGLFINTIPVRIKSEPDMKVADLVKKSADQAIESSNYEYCSLADIQSRSVLLGNLVKTIFVFENYASGGGNLENHFNAEGITEHTNYDISMCTSNPGEEIKLTLIYNPDKYEITEIDRILAMYKNIIQEIVTKPGEKLTRIEMIDKREAQDLINEFNQTYRRYDSETTVAEVFELQSELYPERIAVTYQNETLSYHELNEKANYIAHMLRESGVKPNDFVAIMAEKSTQMIVGIVGIIKSGAAYVPIDPDLPENRIQYMLEDCQPKAVLKYCNREVVGFPVIDLADSLIYENRHKNLSLISAPTDLLYLIYTSGTTGRPKGVMVENKGVLNLRSYFLDVFQVTKEDSVLQFANICFDASVLEISMALLNGASLVVPAKDQIQDTDQFAELVKAQQVSVTLLPPSYYLLTQELDIRIVITGGSQTNKEVIKKTKNRYVNAYGPTENTVCATCWEYRKGDHIPANIPIGKPLNNVQVYILKDLRICSVGVIGELCIAGDSLARGYLNMPEMTAQKFIDNPYGQGKLYRTGDLARWRKDGEIEFIGRVDDQVKISGYRIELQEIESAVRQFPHIADVAIIVIGNSAEEKMICAYLTADVTIDIELLKNSLQEQLPGYMIPAGFMQIDELPMTSSGKLDKKALPPIEATTKTSYTAPKNKLEEVLCDLIRDITGIVNVGVHDNLFEMGVNSLKAIAIVGKIKKMGLNIKIQDIFDKKSVAKIAEKIRNQSSKNHLSKLDKSAFDEALIPKSYNHLLKENAINEMPLMTKKALGNTLITGVTGFLGIHLLAEFMEQEKGKLYCLIRSANEQNAYRRLYETLEYYYGQKYHQDVKKRIFVIAGDMSQRGIAECLPRDVKTVIHSAALTKHYGFEEDFVRINISGTKTILDYAISIKAKFIYISTTSVAERIRSDHKERMIFDEKCFITDQENFSSEYTKTKHQAEKLVLDEKDEGQDTLIIRVGNLTNRSFDGRPIQNYQDNRFMNTIKYIIERGFVNEDLLNMELQFSPVDLVAAAVINLVRLDCRKHSIYHVFNDQKVKFEKLYRILIEFGMDFKIDESFDVTEDKNSEQAIILTEDNHVNYPNIKSDFTKWCLAKSDFYWNQPDELYLQKVVKNFYDNGFWNPAKK